MRQALRLLALGGSGRGDAQGGELDNMTLLVLGGGGAAAAAGVVVVAVVVGGAEGPCAGGTGR